MAQAREQRAQSRERRRSLTSKPFEELNEAADQGEQSTPAATAKRAAATAAAAMVAGAVAGAAKAMLDRRNAQSEAAEADEPNDSQGEETPQAAAEPQPRDEAEEEEQPEADEEAPEEEEDDEPEQPAAEQETTEDEDAGEGNREHEPEQPAADADDEQPSAEAEPGEDAQNGARGGSQSDVTRVVAQAREHLKSLIGTDVESVSGIERANGNWSVTLEVVEMRRIPESTDILSSYLAVLDDDGGIVSLTRGRRYRRSQVED